MSGANDVSRIAWILACLLALIASCSEPASSRPTTASSSPNVTGSYVREGHASDVVLLEAGGHFCISQEAFAIGGTYEVDGDDLVLRPDLSGLGEEGGTIDGDVITDPDGERWIRSEDAPGCEPSLAPGEEAPTPETEELADDVASVSWPVDYEDAARALRGLPETIAGYRAGPVQDASGKNPTASVAFPDPSYAGPVSGVTIVVVGSPPDLRSEQLVDATAHLGFALAGETRRLDDSDDVPLVIGRIEQVEGGGELPPDHGGYLAVWAMGDGDVAFVVIADGTESLMEAVKALHASAA